MKFHLNTSEVFVPDGEPVEQALARTTHLCFSAHQDDIEIMAAQPIIECFQQKDKWFTGVVVSDGRGSPCDGIYRVTRTTKCALSALRNSERQRSSVNTRRS